MMAERGEKKEKPRICHRDDERMKKFSTNRMAEKHTYKCEDTVYSRVSKFVPRSRRIA